MFSLACSLCSVAGGWRNICKEHKSHFFPPCLHQCCRHHLHSEPGSGWGSEDSCVCPLSLPYACVQSPLSKKYPQSLQEHTVNSAGEKVIGKKNKACHKQTQTPMPPSATQRHQFPNTGFLPQMLGEGPWTNEVKPGSVKGGYRSFNV